MYQVKQAQSGGVVGAMQNREKVEWWKDGILTNSPLWWFSPGRLGERKIPQLSRRLII